MENYRKKIGQILFEQKIINQNQLDQALFRQHSCHEQIGQILMDLGFINEAQLGYALSLQANEELIHLSSYRSNRE